MLYTLFIASLMPQVVARRRAAPRKARRAIPRPSHVSARAAPSRPMVRASAPRSSYSMANPGPFGKAGGALGTALGARFGPAGSAVGGILGGGAGHLLGKLFGSGDYVVSSDPVKSNVLVNEAQVPNFSHGKNVVKIRHREYLGDVISSSTAGAFQLVDYAINPGIASSFPWLSQVCGASFQQYRINGMVFEFRSMSADALNSTNTALGSVVMATDYDSKDDTFTTKQEMENTEFGVSCKPSSCMMHAIECARNQTSVSELYIRAGSVPSGADIRLYDLGRFSIATVGFQGTSVNCGELWVSYDLDLIKAIQQPPGFLIPSADYALDPATMATAPWKKLSSGTAFDTIGLTIPDTGLTISLPYSILVNSYWLLNWELTGTATAALNALATLNYTGGLAAVSSIFASPSPNGTLTSSRQQSWVVFKYNGGGTIAVPPTITLTLPTTMMSAYSSGILQMTQLSGSWV